MGVAIAAAIPLAIVFLSTRNNPVPPPEPAGNTAPVDPRVIPPLQAPIVGQVNAAKTTPDAAENQFPVRPSNEGSTAGTSRTAEQVTVEDTVTVSVVEREPGSKANSPGAGSENVAGSHAEEPAAVKPSIADSVKSPSPQGQGGLTEGIGLRTSGFIEIRDPDGTLVSRQEFK